MNKNQSPNDSGILPSLLYDVVSVDYPWRHLTWSDKGRGRSPSNHYSVMDLEKYTELMKALLPICSDRVVICHWVTNVHKVLFAKLLSQWEDDPSIHIKYGTTLFTWGKLNNQANPRQQMRMVDFSKPIDDESLWWKGNGYYSRQNTEEVWVTRRVNGESMRRRDLGVPQFIPAHRPTRHSRKPEIFQKNMERLWGNVNRLELFARPPFLDGWDVMGFEVDGLDIFEALARRQAELEQKTQEHLKMWRGEK